MSVRDTHTYSHRDVHRPKETQKYTDPYTKAATDMTGGCRQEQAPTDWGGGVLTPPLWTGRCPSHSHPQTERSSHPFCGQGGARPTAPHRLERPHTTSVAWEVPVPEPPQTGGSSHHCCGLGGVHPTAPTDLGVLTPPLWPGWCSSHRLASFAHS